MELHFKLTISATYVVPQIDAQKLPAKVGEAPLCKERAGNGGAKKNLGDTMQSEIVHSTMPHAVPQAVPTVPRPFAGPGFGAIMPGPYPPVFNPGMPPF